MPVFPYMRRCLVTVTTGVLHASLCAAVAGFSYRQFGIVIVGSHFQPLGNSCVVTGCDHRINVGLAYLFNQFVQPCDILGLFCIFSISLFGIGDQLIVHNYSGIVCFKRIASILLCPIVRAPVAWILAQDANEFQRFIALVYALERVGGRFVVFSDLTLNVVSCQNAVWTFQLYDDVLVPRCRVFYIQS